MKKLLLGSLMMLIVLCFMPNVQVQAAEELDTVTKIQKAIDNASAKGGGTVTLPAKTINVDKMIILKSNVHLKGAGIGKTKLVVSNTKLEKMLTSDRTTGSEISGITFDAKKDLRKQAINSGFHHTMDFAYAKDFHIHNIEVVNSVDSAIALWYAEHGTIENNVLKNGGANAILGMQKTHHIDVLNNTIDKTDNQNGIFFMFQSESTHDIKIIGNKVSNVADYAIEVGHTTHGEDDAPHRNIVIKDNEIENAYCTGIGLRTVSDAVVENNKINGYAKAESYGCNGIFIEGRVSMQENIKVKNNEIIQKYPDIDDSDPTNYQQAMYITGVKNTEIAGNKIVGSHDIGIKVLAAWFGGQTKDFPTGVRLYNSVNIHDNTIYNSQYHGIYMDGYAKSDSSVNNNTVKGYEKEGILIEGTGVKQSGNVTDPKRVEDPTNPEQPPTTPEEPPTAPEEPPVAPGNLWTNPTAISPLKLGYPQEQRHYLDAGTYRITFSGKSNSGNSMLNLYFDKRERLNEYLKLQSTYQKYTFDFVVPVRQEIFFLDVDGKGDLHVKDISVNKVN